MNLTDAQRARLEARKFGTDTPGKPTDEFVRHAFAEGAKSLWPDSRDPGWHVTFDRWRARRVAAAVQATTERVQALADEWDADPHSDLTQRACSMLLRAALAGSTDPTPDTHEDVPVPVDHEFLNHLETVRAVEADALDPIHDGTPKETP